MDPLTRATEAPASLWDLHKRFLVRRIVISFIFVLAASIFTARVYEKDIDRIMVLVAAMALLALYWLLLFFPRSSPACEMRSPPYWARDKHDWAEICAIVAVGHFLAMIVRVVIPS